MSPHDASALAAWGAWLAAGAGLGAAYFTLLARAVRRHLADPAPARMAALLAARVGLAAGGFWLAAQAGALPLGLALAGFLGARAALVRGAGGRSP